MDIAFAEAAQEARVPPEFATAVLSNFSVAAFARVASSQEASEVVFQELLAEGNLDSAAASERIQAAASLTWLRLMPHLLPNPCLQPLRLQYPQLLH